MPESCGTKDSTEITPKASLVGFWFFGKLEFGKISSEGAKRALERPQGGGDGYGAFLKTRTLEATPRNCFDVVWVANGPKRSMGHVMGPKKLIFLIRDIDDLTVAGASVESCQFVVLRSLRGRLGSVLYTCKRLRRIRRRFKHFWSNSLSRPLALAIF